MNQSKFLTINVLINYDYYKKNTAVVGKKGKIILKLPV